MLLFESLTWSFLLSSAFKAPLKKHSTSLLLKQICRVYAKVKNPIIDRIINSQCFIKAKGLQRANGIGSLFAYFQFYEQFFLLFPATMSVVANTDALCPIFFYT